MPKLLLPDFHFKSVLSIKPEFLKEHCIFALILDLDNTLALHGEPLIEKGIPDWLKIMKEQKIYCVILSNNRFSRVSLSAEKLGLPFVSSGLKPLNVGVKKSVKILAKECPFIRLQNIAIVGDQILTDILAGNFFGIKTILVEPFEMEKNIILKTKRKIEDSLIRPVLPLLGDKE